MKERCNPSPLISPNRGGPSSSFSNGRTTSTQNSQGSGIPTFDELDFLNSKIGCWGNFQLNHNMVQLLISNRQFAELSYQDPQLYLQNFIELTDTFIPTRVSLDCVRMTLFPHSLLGEAKRQLNADPTNSITSWDDLARKFLIRFFLSGKTARLRSEIVSFKQKPYENLNHAWECFNALLQDCLHQQQSNEVLAHTFVKALDHNTKILLDIVIGGQELELT